MDSQHLTAHRSLEDNDSRRKSRLRTLLTVDRSHVDSFTHPRLGVAEHIIHNWCAKWALSLQRRDSIRGWKTGQASPGLVE
jgi:hypothetical protein